MAHLALRSRIAPLLGTLALAAVASVGASGIAHADFPRLQRDAIRFRVGMAIFPFRLLERSGALRKLLVQVSLIEGPPTS